MAALHELIEDLQNALAQTMRGMVALAAVLWSGHILLHQRLHPLSAPSRMMF